jgi:site-specific DNA-cytosine methylase
VAAIDNAADAMATYYCNLCDENTKIIGEIPKKDRKWFGKPDGYRTHLAGREQIPPVRAVFIKDILDVSGWEMMDAAGVEEVDLIVGSPPCQSFSKCNMNKKKKGEDLRDFLLFEFGRLILEIHPKTFVMENVPQIATATLPDGRNLMKVFQEMTKEYDWDLYYEITRFRRCIRRRHGHIVMKGKQLHWGTSKKWRHHSSSSSAIWARYHDTIRQ